MDVAVFSSKGYDERSLSAADPDGAVSWSFLEPRLTEATAPLASGHDAVCAFVNDDLSAPVLEILSDCGVGFVALRSAGYNHVDLDAAARLGIRAARVPAYSPYAVAEHALGLILALNRHIHRAYNRVREGNFSLEGLIGFDMHDKTAGIVGTGTIGRVFAGLLSGFGMRLLGSDPQPSDGARELGVEYVAFEELLAASDIIALFAPLTEQTHHLIDAAAIERMRPGTMLINTSRGALVDTQAAIDGLKSGRLGSLGLDVYEEEGPLFFEDRSMSVITDDLFSRLLTFPNVVITGHQAFFTAEAVEHIAETTVGNLRAWASGEALDNEVASEGRAG